MRAFAWSTIFLLLATPLVQADEIDVHAGADEASETCTGFRQEESYEYSWGNGVNEGSDAGSWGSYDETCSWRESAAAARVAKDDEEIASADVGERSEGARRGEYSRWERHQTLCDGAPCDVRSSYVYAWGESSRSSRTGAHASALGQDASLDRSRCEGTARSWENSWGEGSYEQGETASACEGGLFLRAADQTLDTPLYACASTGETSDSSYGSWEQSFRSCAIGLAPPRAAVDGTGTPADGTGLAAGASYQDVLASNCFEPASGKAWCEGGEEGATLILTVALDIGPSWSHAVRRDVPVPRLVALP